MPGTWIRPGITCVKAVDDVHCRKLCINEIGCRM
jgi:hypothetical protein